MAQGGQLAYVLFRSKLHVFSQAGELTIPPRIRDTLASLYFGGRQRQ